MAGGGLMGVVVRGRGCEGITFFSDSPKPQPMSLLTQELITLSALISTDAALAQTFVIILASTRAATETLSRRPATIANAARIATMLTSRNDALASLRIVHARMTFCRARAAALLGPQPALPDLAPFGSV